MECLARRAADRKWNQPKREREREKVSLNSAARGREPYLTLDIELHDFTYPAEFYSCFGPVYSSHYISIFLFLYYHILCVNTFQKYVIFLLIFKGE